MNETMMIEAIRSAGVNNSAQMATSPAAAPDPAAVAQFQAAMATPPTTSVGEIPLAGAISKTWTVAHQNNQGIIHRLRALSELGSRHAPNSVELIEMQYEVANLAFQQDVVAKVADKTSQAIQTLIKNQ